MKHILQIGLLFLILSCNSKSDSAVSKIKKPDPEKSISKKPSGREIILELEKLGYFNLTEPHELDTVKVYFEKNYTDLIFFQGPLRGESLIFRDNRYHWVDCEDLFEIGGLTKYLNQVKPTFEKLGLQLKVANEKSEYNSEKWKHTIELNGSEYIAFNGKFTDSDWEIAYLNFLEMVNTELKKQNSKEQFYPINCGNAGSFVLLTPEQLNFINSHYPLDNEHPTTLINWKRKNGIEMQQNELSR